MTCAREPMRELVLGGARSGKSALAQRLARASGLPVTVIATAQPGDAEMAARIARHRAERPPDWRVAEAPVALAAALRGECAAGRCVLVDCLTLWLSNAILADLSAGGEDTAASAALPTLAAERAALLSALPGLPGRVIVVTNEVGSGIVPANALARRYRDEAGALNAAVAAQCERVTLVAAGLPLVLKGPPL